MSRLWVWLATGVVALAVALPAGAEGEEDSPRDQAIALYLERCEPFKDPGTPERAPQDFLQLLQWGYTPDEVLGFAQAIPETCLQISFLDAIATVIRTTADPMAVAEYAEDEVISVYRGRIRPLEGPEVALPVIGVSLIVAGTIFMWLTGDQLVFHNNFAMMATGISLCVVSVGMVWTPDRPGPGRPPGRTAKAHEISWTVGPGSLLVRF
jgi:hypothetical protein